VSPRCRAATIDTRRDWYYRRPNSSERGASRCWRISSRRSLASRATTVSMSTVRPILLSRSRATT
jgi:hypothetical protein